MWYFFLVINGHSYKRTVRCFIFREKLQKIGSPEGWCIGGWPLDGQQHLVRLLRRDPPPSPSPPSHPPPPPLLRGPPIIIQTLLYFVNCFIKSLKSRMQSFFLNQFHMYSSKAKVLSRTFGFCSFNIYCYIVTRTKMNISEICSRKAEKEHFVCRL